MHICLYRASSKNDDSLEMISRPHALPGMFSAIYILSRISMSGRPLFNLERITTIRWRKPIYDSPDLHSTREKDFCRPIYMILNYYLYEFRFYKI